MRETVREIKGIGLSLNRLLYVDGNMKKGHSMRHDDSQYTLEQCLSELERIRCELWWIYNDNQEFAESSGFSNFD